MPWSSEIQFKKLTELDSFFFLLKNQAATFDINTWNASVFLYCLSICNNPLREGMLIGDESNVLITLLLDRLHKRSLTAKMAVESLRRTVTFGFSSYSFCLFKGGSLGFSRHLTWRSPQGLHVRS